VPAGSVIQQVELSRQLLLVERFTKGAVQTAKTAQHLLVAKQGRDTPMLLQRCRDHHQQLATCAQPRQTGFEVPTDRFQL